MVVATAVSRAMCAGMGDRGGNGCSEGVGDSNGCSTGGSKGDGAGDSNSFGNGHGNGCGEGSCLAGILVLPNRMIMPKDLRRYNWFRGVPSTREDCMTCSIVVGHGIMAGNKPH